MRMDKLTSRFQQALADAQSLAVGRDHPAIEPSHLLHAMLDQDGGTTQPLLQNAGINIEQIRPKQARIIDELTKTENAIGEDTVPLAPATAPQRTDQTPLQNEETVKLHQTVRDAT